jgi:hypothetical protein
MLSGKKVSIRSLIRRGKKVCPNRVEGSKIAGEERD